MVTARSRGDGRKLCPTGRTRVLIVDDHELLRAGLKELLRNESSLEVCGEAAGESEAMAVVRTTHPKLVIIDVALQQGNGIDLIKRIKAYDPSVDVIVCSMYDESLYAERALRAGAVGYVHKQAPATTIVEAIREVLAGNLFLSPRMIDRLVRTATNTTRRGSASSVESFSDRELEVFTLIGGGLTTGQIAKKLHLSPRTVETYRERLKAKLNLETAAELNRYAVEWVLRHG